MYPSCFYIFTLSYLKSQSWFLFIHFSKSYYLRSGSYREYICQDRGCVIGLGHTNVPDLCRIAIIPRVHRHSNRCGINYLYGHDLLRHSFSAFKRYQRSILKTRAGNRHRHSCIGWHAIWLDALNRQWRQGSRCW